MVTLRVDRRESPLDRTCPYCRGAIGDPSPVTCTGCGASLHADCWRELGGCPTIGCSERAAPRARAAAVAPPPVQARPAPPRPRSSWRDLLDLIRILAGLYLALFVGAVMTAVGAFPDVVREWVGRHGLGAVAIVAGAALLVAGLVVRPGRDDQGGPTPGGRSR